MLITNHIRGGGGGDQGEPRKIPEQPLGLALVFRKLDNAVHRINRYPTDTC